jgi:hypothetical protein
VPAPTSAGILFSIDTERPEPALLFPGATVVHANACRFRAIISAGLAAIGFAVARNSLAIRHIALAGGTGALYLHRFHIRCHQITSFICLHILDALRANGKSIVTSAPFPRKLAGACYNPSRIEANRLRFGAGSMSEEKPVPKSHGRSSSKDITPFLKGWDYEPGTINVRKINGLDGSPKIQVRQPLGLYQMELTGRPDGARPHGCESLLEYYEEQLTDHTRRNGTELGFHLTAEQCEALREEAGLYYHRYLGLYVLEDFDAVVRDTARNLRVLDFCSKFAVDEDDRLVLEQYRPYITMMNTRAAASILFKDEKYKEALEKITEGLETIKAFFERFGQPEAYPHANEVKVLKQFARDVRKKLPIDPLVKLQAQLDKAVRSERYEDAARLRDEIKKKSDSRA